MTMLHSTLNARRKALGMTYDAVHAALELYRWPEGVTCPAWSTVGRWLNGTRTPRNVEHLRALCAVLGLSLADLFRDVADPGHGRDFEHAFVRLLRDLSDEQARELYAIGCAMREAARGSKRPRQTRARRKAVGCHEPESGASGAKATSSRPPRGVRTWMTGRLTSWSRSWRSSGMRRCDRQIRLPRGLRLRR